MLYRHYRVVYPLSHEIGFAIFCGNYQSVMPGGRTCGCKMDKTINSGLLVETDRKEFKKAQQLTAPLWI
jgi:hypothetical protein